MIYAVSKSKPVCADRMLGLRTCMLVCAGIAELSSKQLHAHDGTEGYEEGNEHSYVHQGD